MSDAGWDEAYDKLDEQHNNEPFWRTKHFDNDFYEIVINKLKQNENPKE